MPDLSDIFTGTQDKLFVKGLINIVMSGSHWKDFEWKNGRALEEVSLYTDSLLWHHLFLASPGIPKTWLRLGSNPAGLAHGTSQHSWTPGCCTSLSGGWM